MFSNLVFVSDSDSNSDSDSQIEEKSERPSEDEAIDNKLPNIIGNKSSQTSKHLQAEDSDILLSEPSLNGSVDQDIHDEQKDKQEFDQIVQLFSRDL